jgi:hypothetical protein
MTLNVSVWDIISTIVQSVTAIAALLLAFVALRLNAKPGIRVHVTRNGGPVTFAPGEEGVLSIYVELRGFFYGKPTATEMQLTVNVADNWGLRHLSWNAPGESETDQVGRGKGLRAGPRWIFWRRLPGTGPSNFLVARHLWLTRYERGETVYATVIAPEKPGPYLGWIHALANEGDCGVHMFGLRCSGGGIKGEG